MHAERFHFPAKHYLLSHSVGAQPVDYESAMATHYRDPWRNSGSDIWDAWFEIADRFRAGVAPIIGVDAKDITAQNNVSSGVAKVLFSLPARPGRNKIILSEDDFPTVGYALAQGARHGYDLIFLPGGNALANPDHWQRAFADDVQLICAMGVYSNSNVRAPLREIAQRAQQSGAYTLFDIAQTAGVIPLTLEEWGADFAVGTSQKYLCGGAGAAYLYARKETARACQPLDVGWFSHAQPFAFDIHDFQYADGAERYTGGTPSFAPLAGALPGQNIINDIGVDIIHEHTQRLLSRLFDAVPEGAVLSARQRSNRGAGAIIKPRVFENAVAALRDAGIAHDARLGGIRLSFHFYNNEADVDAVIETLTPWLE